MEVDAYLDVAARSNRLILTEIANTGELLMKQYSQAMMIAARIWQSVVIAGFMSVPLAANAQTAAVASPIKISVGWGDALSIILISGAMPNPAGCPNVDAAMSEPNRPGYKTHYAAALLAYSMGKPVTVTVDNGVCAHGRPAILALYLN